MRTLVRLLVSSLGISLLVAAPAMAAQDQRPVRLWSVSKVVQGSGEVPVAGGAQVGGKLEQHAETTTTTTTTTTVASSSTTVSVTGEEDPTATTPPQPYAPTTAVAVARPVGESDAFAAFERGASAQ